MHGNSSSSGKYQWRILKAAASTAEIVHREPSQDREIVERSRINKSWPCTGQHIKMKDKYWKFEEGKSYASITSLEWCLSHWNSTV